MTRKMRLVALEGLEMGLGRAANCQLAAEIAQFWTMHTESGSESVECERGNFNSLSYP